MKTINDYQKILDNIKKLDVDSVSEIDIVNIAWLGYNKV